MTKEMFWLLMGHLVCIGQWAAFIMVDHAFLGRGRRFRFPCLWAALLAAVFLVASIRHDIGFFNVESVILNVIYLLVTVLFFGGSWNQKLSACLVNGIMCLLTENTVSYTFAWCKHIPVREVWRYRSCLFLLVAAVVGAGLLAAYIIRRWRREQALTPLQMLVMSFFPGIVVVLNIVLMVSGGSEVPSMMNMMLTFGLTIAVLIHLGIVQMVNDQMLLQQTLMVEAVRQKKSAEALLESYKTQRRLTHGVHQPHRCTGSAASAGRLRGRKGLPFHAHKDHCGEYHHYEHPQPFIGCPAQQKVRGGQPKRGHGLF